MTDNRTTEQTATERLRKLLDEREVEWKDYGHENHTWWSGNENVGWHAENRPSANGLYVKIEAVLTPEQAIAATLGEVDDSGCYLDFEGKKYPAELDFGFLGLMPITITVGGFRYLMEVPNGE